MQQFDVVIIGGGVAGSALALSLKQHQPELSVAVLESSDYSRPRIGETLPPHCIVPLQQLGLWEDFLQAGHLPSHGTSAAWGQPELHRNEFLFSPYGPGWHLDRTAFDRWMAGQAQGRGAVLHLQSRLLDHRRQGEGWRFTVGRPGERLEMTSRFAVDATGRKALFARHRGVSKAVCDRLVGIYLFWELKNGLADSEALIEAQPDSWWYSALLPGGRLAAALMTDSDIAAGRGLRHPDRWTERLGRTLHTRKRLAAAAPCGRPKIASARSQRLDPPCGPDWLAVGDAASTYDPLSSQGIFKALRTAIWAGYAILDRFKGKTDGLRKYEMLLEGEYRSYLQKRQEIYAQERRWPDSAFWRRRQ